MLKMFVEL
jgi:hypothetical protein